ncbi:hypothetical protein [Acinetobacter bereziniae]|uniref:hypothetical protein n=1 Tax=Acinetobacter bereziniae TaxID=106648 RepID=UPI0018FF1F09|nr:hypothetical protein [Acinetobacter bereziniae]MBJ8424576.1 hypothetical protein [Acinetobacter bereziniae]
MALTDLDTRVALAVQTPQVDFNQLLNNSLDTYNTVKGMGQQGILSRLLAQNTGADGQVNLAGALQSAQTNPNQAYQSGIVNILSNSIQQQNAAKLKAQQEAIKFDADTNKTYAETGKLQQEGLGKGLENGGKKFGAINQVFQGSALNGSKADVLLGLQGLYQAGIIDADTFNQQREIVNVMQPEDIKAYASSIAFGNAKDPASILYQSADNAADNATSEANNKRTTNASIYSTDVGAQTADKNRAQQGEQFQQNYALNLQKAFFEQNKPTSYGYDTQGRQYAVLPNGKAVYVKDEHGGYVIGQQKGSSLQNSQKEEAQRIERVDAVLPMIEDLIPKSTNSYVGRGLDYLVRGFGGANNGDIVTDQLKTLSGQLVALMPKMSGPQSDKDVAMYKEMAGNLSDPTKNKESRLAALNTIRQLNEKYKNLNQQKSKVVQLDTSFMP